MFDPKLIFEARWEDLFVFFTTGSPPLVLRLLIINTIFIVFFAIRRARSSQPKQGHSVYFVQALLIAANAFVMFGPDLMEAAKLARHIV